MAYSTIRRQHLLYADLLPALQSEDREEVDSWEAYSSAEEDSDDSSDADLPSRPPPPPPGDASDSDAEEEDAPTPPPLKFRVTQTIHAPAIVFDAGKDHDNRDDDSTTNSGAHSQSQRGLQSSLRRGYTMMVDARQQDEQQSQQQQQQQQQQQDQSQLLAGAGGHETKNSTLQPNNPSQFGRSRAASWTSAGPRSPRLSAQTISSPRLPKGMTQAIMRKRVAEEIAATEQAYVVQLQTIFEGFRKPLVRKGGFGLTNDEISFVFGNIEALYRFHSDFVRQIQDRTSKWAESSCLGDIFLKNLPFLKCYIEYFNNYDARIELICEKATTSKLLREFLENIHSNPYSGGGSRFLEDLMITPIQRLPRYCLLLVQLCKATPHNHADFGDLTDALTRLRALVDDINARQRQEEATRKICTLQKLSFKGCRLQLKEDENSKIRVNSDGKQIEDYAPMPLIDFNASRQLIYDSPVGHAFFLDKEQRSVGKVTKCRLFLFSDALGLAVVMNDAAHPFKFTHWAEYRNPLQAVMVRLLVSSPVVMVSKVRSDVDASSTNQNLLRSAETLSKGKTLSRKVKVFALHWPDGEVHAMLLSGSAFRDWLAHFGEHLPDGALKLV